MLPVKDLLLVPTVFAYELNKPAAAECTLMQAVFIPVYFDQFLHVLVTDRHDQAAAFRQLLDQHRRYLRGARRNDDRIKGALIRPAGGAVRIAGHNIVILKLVEKPPGFYKQGVDTLYGVDPEGDFSIL